MRYVIMADGDGKRWNNYMGIPKHLVKINGESILARTIRLLQENGIEDIIITSQDKRYDFKNTIRIPQTDRDCEIDRFEESVLKNITEVCYIYGDVYYTEEAIKTIINTGQQGIHFFGHQWEIVAIKVFNIPLFLKHKNKIKKLYLSKQLDRCIGWEIYRSLNNLPLKEHNILKGYHFIEDGTDDIDYPEDYETFKMRMEAHIMFKNDITLIIPCHNLEEYIQPCLNSICNQENNQHIRREVIFICDNCTDNTYNIIKRKMKKSSWKFRIIKTQAGSPGEARNIGLDNADSQYIWFIDGDDWLTENNAIDELYRLMLQDDMDIIEFKIKSNANPEGDFGGGTVWRCMLSNRIIGETRFNDRQTGEDNDFIWEIYHKPGVKYGKIAFAPYFYNFPREGSQSWLKAQGLLE